MSDVEIEIDLVEETDETDEPAADEPARSKRERALVNEGGRAHVSIVTDADILVGRDGEVLEALQELARLAVMTETGHRSRLMLDVAGHRDKRRKELEVLAKDAIAEVVDTGESVRLTPMNPFERKIVHDAVAAAGLTSESEGEEPTRRVVVLPKG